MVIFIILMVIVVVFLIIGTVQVTPEMIAAEKLAKEAIKEAKRKPVNYEEIKKEIATKVENAAKIEKTQVKAEAKAQKELEKQKALDKKLLAKKVRSIKGKTPSEKIVTLEEMLKANEISENEFVELKNALIMEI